MMRILVFFVLLFGLFGIFVSQYISQYREIYRLWIKEIIYGADFCDYDPKERSQLCSSVESYCREVCSLANALFVLLLGIISTGIVALYVLKVRLSEIDVADSGEILLLQADQALLLLLMFSIHSILKASNIDILHTAKTSQIDRNLFHIWCKVKCHESKNDFRKNLVPNRMYVLLHEKINDYNKDQESDEAANKTKNPANKPEEKFVYSLIENMKENPDEWKNLLDLLKYTKKEKTWNPISWVLRDKDYEFLSYLITISLIVIPIFLTILFGLTPEIKAFVHYSIPLYFSEAKIYIYNYISHLL